jgi:hypothetical protein
MSEILSHRHLAGAVEAVWRNSIENVRSLLRFNVRPFYVACVLHIAVFAVLFSLWPRLDTTKRRAALCAGTALAATFVALTLFYLLRNWTVCLRVLMFVMPWALPPLAGVLSDIAGRRKQIAAFALSCVVLLVISARLHTALTSLREEEHNYGDAFANAILAISEHLSPNAVMIDNRYPDPNSAFVYGWKAYPVTVVWTVPDNLEALDSIDARLPIDLIVAKPSAHDWLPNRTGDREARDYVLLPGEIEGGYRVYAHARLLREGNGEG